MKMKTIEINGQFHNVLAGSPADVDRDILMEAPGWSTREAAEEAAEAMEAMGWLA